jgi:hypothetical protein
MIDWFLHTGLYVLGVALSSAVGLGLTWPKAVQCGKPGDGLRAAMRGGNPFLFSGSHS